MASCLIILPPRSFRFIIRIAEKATSRLHQRILH
jgi:hypothetical protein